MSTGDALTDFFAKVKIIGTSTAYDGLTKLWAFISNPATIAGIGLAGAAWASYETSIESSVNKAEESSKALSIANKELSDAQLKRDENTKSIEELSKIEEKDRTAQQNAELRGLEAQNNLLEAQVKIREEQQKIAEDQAATDAKAALTNNRGHWWQSIGASIRNGKGDGNKVETKDIVSETRDLIAERTKLEETLNNASDKILTLKPETADYEEQKQIISNAEKDISKLSSKIADNKSTILSLYESLIGSDGNVKAGYEDIAASVESLMPEVNPIKYVENSFRGMGQEAQNLLTWFNKLDSGEKNWVFKTLSEDTDAATWSARKWNAELDKTKKIEEALANLNTLDKFKESVNSAVTAQSNLNAALSAGNSATGMTEEHINNIVSAFGELENFDMATLFEKTANGVKMNTEAFKKYNKILNLKEQTKLLGKIAAKQEEINNLSEDDPKRETYTKELETMKLLYNSYDGVISKYNEYVQATSSANERDNLAGVANGYKSVEQLLKGGWSTDDSVIAYLDLMVGEERRKQIGDNEKAFQSLSDTIDGTSNSLRSYLTLDGSGNLTADGVDKFVNDLYNLSNSGILSGIATDNGDGTTSFDFSPENVQAIADHFKTSAEYINMFIRAMGEHGFSVETENSKKTLEELQNDIADWESEKARIEVEVDADEAQDQLDDINEQIEATKRAAVATAIDDKVQGGTSIKDLYDIANGENGGEEITATLGLDISQAEEAIAQVNALAAQAGLVPMKVSLDDSSISALKDANGEVNFELGDYPKEVPAATGKVNYALGKVELPNLKLDGVINWTSTGGGAPGGEVNGVITPHTGTMTSIARADGTAYNVLNLRRISPSHAGGNVSLTKDEYALTNEVGRESIVRDGVWYMLPPGPHMEHLKKGDIVFNAKQTADLLSGGRTGTYAKSYATGTLTSGKTRGYALTDAYLTRGALDKILRDSFKATGKVDGGSSGGSGNWDDSDDSDDDKDDKEGVGDVDWIEVTIKRIQRIITNFTKVAENAFKGLNTRLGGTKDAISKITEEIDIQKKAAEGYLAQADTIELYDNYKEWVREGRMDFTTLSDNNVKRIGEYRDLYEKYLECLDKAEDLKKDLAGLYRDMFDMVEQNAENQISIIEHNANMAESRIDYLNERGYLAGTEIYNTLISAEKERMSVLEKEAKDLESYLNESVKSGLIDEYSEEWYSMKIAINDVKEEIDESNISLVKFNNTIRDINWDNFDYIQDRIERITSEADFLIKLLSDSELTGDNGLNEKGVAVAGLHAQNYSTYMNQAEGYAKEIQNIEAQIAKDPYNTELIERREKLIDLQQKAIISANDEKKAITDLIEDGINSEIDSLNDLIAKYKESLDASKNLYDYQKKVSSQTSKIADLEKQISAYSGNTSEEAAATIQKLNKSLKEAQESLQDTEYDQYISDQKKMLDDLSSEFDDLLNERLDNIDSLLEDTIKYINSNSSEIIETISSSAKEVGYILSDSIGSIWKDNYQTGTSNAISGIYDYVNAMVFNSNSLAKKKYATGGLVDYTGLAQVDGTPQKPEAFLNQKDTRNLLMLKEALSSMISGSRGVALTGINDMSDALKSIANSTNSIGNIDVGGVEINIPIDHVEDYDDFFSKMKYDKNFEKMVRTMTTDMIVGGSALSKYKY